MTPFSYIDRGLSILPLKAGSKRPIGRWRRWMHEPMTAAQALAWWGGGFRPTPNVGIVCGPVSGGLVVLDIEPEHVDLASTFDWPSAAPRVVTHRGGLHLYFSGVWPCGKLAVPIDSEGRTRVIGDVRGAGGYVVAPPSETEHGIYQWSPRWADDRREWFTSQLPPVPEWVTIAKRTPAGRDVAAAPPRGAVPTPCGRSFLPVDLARYLPGSLVRAMRGWLPFGSFESASEIDFRIVRELIHVGADYESIERFFAEMPIATHVRDHLERDPSYLWNTYKSAAFIAGREVEEAVELRCVRSILAVGSLHGGARTRMLLEFVEDDGDLYQYAIAHTLGPPQDGDHAGEWWQLRAAYGDDRVLDPVPPDYVWALVNGSRVLRLLSVDAWPDLGAEVEPSE